MGSMRQLFSRVFDLALGGAIALLLISSASETSISAAKGASPTSADADFAPPPPAIDPKAQFLVEQVREGRHWRFDTDSGPVHVWIPRDYDATTAQTVLYVHGYWQDADAVWTEHHLPE